MSNMIDKVHNWALYDRDGQPIQSFHLFDEAVQVLATMPGEWGANWSLVQLIKGVHSVSDYTEQDKK